MTTLQILIPTFALIVAGFLLRRHAGFNPGFWSDLEWLIYYILFPALLFGSLARHPLEIQSAAGMIYTGFIFMLAGMALGYLGQRWMRLGQQEFASAFQCAFRFNSYIGFAILGGLYGAEGVAVFAILTGFMVPLANVGAVWALARHGNHGLLRELARNPLVLSTFAGLAWSLSGWSLPTMIDTTLGFLGEAALPLGLIAVGAGLQLAGVGRHAPAIAYLTLVKLIAVPAISVGAAMLFGISGVYLAAALVLAALPTASSAYILAVRMGGDGQIVAALIATHTLAAAITLPLWLFLIQ
ncbi:MULTISPECIES: AEC family transporter [unclassified Ectothiorhodospira]|uniref:AEC family transporter n=1 Tax=unclassified Ectothiorhodospira TaxID=2684909 RepID=UPI001EE95922|nr:MULTISPECIES: AEC family transporter [unclassified Ectothiorhodospira]MCG5516077.1 AEC family transporter [Ectothiorhodospira sp. 9100]MCG5519113.1 AEC family transporter [Ectothiorhodospira sp. 9905]